MFIQLEKRYNRESQSLTINIDTFKRFHSRQCELRGTNYCDDHFRHSRDELKRNPQMDIK